MATTLTLRHERVDDIPLIIGVANRLQLAEVLDRHLGTHSLQEGLSNGWLIVGWLAYILSHADHRKSAVQAWANAMPHTLEHLLGQPIRTVEFSDDRLGRVLRRLSDATAWDAIERDLWAATVAVYELALTGIRLDSTTSYGYHQVTDTGLMQLGHSKGIFAYRLSCGARHERDHLKYRIMLCNAWLIPIAPVFSGISCEHSLA